MALGAVLWGRAAVTVSRATKKTNRKERKKTESNPDGN
jgi:hypothetical protein